jgi:hypothetical protein
MININVFLPLITNKIKTNNTFDLYLSGRGTKGSPWVNICHQIRPNEYTSVFSP